MNASAVAYLAPRAVLAVKLTPAPRPRHASRSGYGTQVPTATLIQLPDKRWRRVYVCITSNIGTSYVRTARAPFLVIGPEAQETIAACEASLTGASSAPDAYLGCGCYRECTC